MILPSGENAIAVADLFKCHEEISSLVCVFHNRIVLSSKQEAKILSSGEKEASRIAGVRFPLRKNSSPAFALLLI